MPEIRNISAQETFTVRHPVLRKGKPIGSCYFEGDDLATTLHFGLFEDHKIAGIISLFENHNPLFADKNQMQFRGMAVLENKQGEGFGRLLMIHCETLLRKGSATLIWFNARENAVGFYQKMSYETLGNSFDIPGVGIHYIMWKNLRS